MLLVLSLIGTSRLVGLVRLHEASSASCTYYVGRYPNHPSQQHQIAQGCPKKCYDSYRRTRGTSCLPIALFLEFFPETRPLPIGQGLLLMPGVLHNEPGSQQTGTRSRINLPISKFPRRNPTPGFDSPPKGLCTSRIR